MTNYKLIQIVTLFLLINGGLSIKEIFCPSYCQCDIIQQFKRAICRNRNLISVDAEIPVEVELLDLSYNIIYELNDHVFIDLNLTSLKLLNLSYNKISQIHMNAFSEMNVIRTIDLSFNNIEYLLENWFWDLSKLEELYLRGNNLRNLREGPILESKTMKILDISKCSLLHIHNDAFSKLQNLKMLDISENALIQLSPDVVRPLINLKILELEKNSWKCNDMKHLAKYLKKKNVIFKNVCSKRLSNIQEKFQRMVAQSNITTEISRNSWLLEERSNEKNNTVVVTCIKNEQKGLLLTILELSPVLTLIVSFVFGLIFGLSISFCCVSASSVEKVKKKRIPSQRNSIIRNRRGGDFHNDLLLQPECFEVCDSTPAPLRRNIF